MTSYIALLRKEAAGDYGVDFPDFPGCSSAGKTLDEARRMAAEALALHVRGMVEDGDPLPAPSTLEAVMQDRANAAAVAFLVDVPAPPDRAVRVQITMAPGTLAEIDASAQAEHKSRSAWLSDAAREKIGRARTGGA